MIGGFVVEVLLEAVFWVVVEVFWRGVKLLVRALYRLIALPLALLGNAAPGSGDGDGEHDDGD